MEVEEMLDINFASELYERRVTICKADEKRSEIRKGKCD